MTGTNVAKLESPPPKKRKLLETLADKYGVEPDVFMSTVSQVAMPKEHTREELISCLIVANEHDLNPLTKEIHFMRPKQGGIQPIVGVDGWVKKMNEHPQFDGCEFEYDWEEKAPGKKRELIAVTAKIWRKDRSKPTVVTEFMAECFRRAPEGKTNAWSTNPMRMLRHRALVQGVRYAMGFAGVMDYQEFQDWQDSLKDVTPEAAAPALDIPEEILSEIAEAEILAEPDGNQDPMFEDPQMYLDQLEAALQEAANQDEFDTTWTSYEDEHQHRLDSEWQKKAIAVRDRVKKQKKFKG